MRAGDFLMAYRDAVDKRRPSALVQYRPTHPLALVGILALVCLMSGLTLQQASTYARSVRLDCVHSDHTCFVRRTYGFVTTSQELPTRDLFDVTVTSHSGKNSTSYGVALRTRTESIALIRPGSRARADLVASGVRSLVFESRPDASLGMPLEDAAPISAFFLGLMGIGIFAMLFLFTGTARLEFDLDRRVVRYRRQRWPLAPVRKSFELNELGHARVTERRGSKGAVTHSVILGLNSEPDLELVPTGGGSKKRNDHVAAKINALLDKMQESEA